MAKKIIKFIIGSLIVLLILFGVNHLYFNRKEVVTGKIHIYRGQTLPEDFGRPETLKKLSERASYLNTDQYLISKAKYAVENLIRDAEKDGMCLVVYGSYRSKKRQKEIREIVKKEKPNKIDRVALPNQSEHRTGMAVDFVGCPIKNGYRDDSVKREALKKSLNELPEYQWLKKNAHKYNFEQSFKKTNKGITGFDTEPWHWKFIIDNLKT